MIEEEIQEEKKKEWEYGQNCPECGSSNYGTIDNEEKSTVMEIIPKCRNCGFEGDPWVY